MAHLILLETSGNQAFLFATNRLRENVGASELTYQAGTRLVLEAVKENGGPSLSNDDPAALRKGLLDQSASGSIRVIVATSGKSLLLVSDQKTGQRIVAYVTRAALEQMPGLDIAGVISDPFEWTASPIHEQVKKIHQQFEQVRSRRPQPNTRFPTLPVCQPCASSGLPASSFDNKDKPLSWMSECKRASADAWRTRIGRIMKQQDRSRWLANNLGQLDDWDQFDNETQDLDWRAVVHADGNGLGRIFLDFDRHCGVVNATGNEHYVEQLQKFSIALEEATETAFTVALEAFPAHPVRRGRTRGLWVPVFPLVLGGDDLTVICDGRYALAFTRRFLTAFEQQTGRADHHDGVISRIANAALGQPRLGICAGVAIIKPHFPFHSAYGLAEELLKSAKNVKQRLQHTHNGKDGPFPASALDFHILYDASFTDLDTVREHLNLGGHTRLTARPYVTTPPAQLPVGHAWAGAHHLNGLLQRVRAILREDDGRRTLPNSQLHVLREALFQGHQQADHQLQLIYSRYKQRGLDQLLESTAPNRESLFRAVVVVGSPLQPTLQTDEYDGQAPAQTEVAEEPHPTFHETRFLDAIESAPFWREGENHGAPDDA